MLSWLQCMMVSIVVMVTMNVGKYCCHGYHRCIVVIVTMDDGNYCCHGTKIMTIVVISMIAIIVVTVTSL